jgi:streptomycin 6-kinase
MPSVLAMAERGPDWAAWVDRIEGLLAGLLEEWRLTSDGSWATGFASVVLPVRDQRGAPLVLKVGFPDTESEHEHLALTRWDGDGAVRLVRADPHRRALLLERLGGSLIDSWDQTACEIVAGLYSRLHRPTGAPFTPLSAAVAPALDDLAALPRSAPVPHRLVEQAVTLGRALITEASCDGTLIHTDLHYENVLIDDAGTWRAIDPKPLSGDPHYEVAPMLWNRFDELAGDVRRGVRRRFHTIIDAAGLDEDRARDWVVVRMLVNALEVRDVDWLTTCVAVAKAVQD